MPSRSGYTSFASPRPLSHRKTSRHRSLTRIEWRPSRLPRSFSKWLLGGDLRSRSVVASSIIWILRNRRSSRSDGIFFDRTSLTKNSRNQSSRKLRIMPRTPSEAMYHAMTHIAIASATVDLVFANESELHALCQTSDFDTALAQLRSDAKLGV